MDFSSLSASQITSILQGGVIGVFLILFLTRRIVPGEFYKEEREQRLESERYEKEVLIPLVQKMADNQDRATAVLTEIQEERRQELAYLRGQQQQAPPPRARRAAGHAPD